MLVGAGVGALATVGLYVRALRPRQMRWGATAAEVGRELPGDALVPRATWNATRAVTVHARPEEIWPWLLQIGWGRGGWYGYDWADNGGRPSAWEILPEHQTIVRGKRFPMSPWTAQTCIDFEPEAWMLWRPHEDRGGTWLWYLDPIDAEHTRLITRMRDRYRWLNPVALVPQIAVDLVDWPFMRKCMLGVKARAERLADVRRASL